MERRILQEFIEIYRSEPSLWKMRCPLYNNRTVKNQAYRRMVAKLREIYPNADLDMVKKKVNALRTNYRKEMRKVEASRERQALTGEPLYVPSLWYFDLFHFIAEDQEEMEEDNTPLIDVSQEDGAMMRAEYESNLHYDGGDMSDEFEEEFQASSSEISNHNLQHAAKSYQNNGHPPPFKRPRHFYKEEDQEEPQAVRWLSNLNHEPPSPPPPPPPDPQDIFGRYVASKLRQMDKSQQMLSERLVSEVLFQGQMGLLGRKTCLSDDETSTNVIKVEE